MPKHLQYTVLRFDRLIRPPRQYRHKKRMCSAINLRSRPPYLVLLLTLKQIQEVRSYDRETWNKIYVTFKLSIFPIHETLVQNYTSFRAWSPFSAVFTTMPPRALSPPPISCWMMLSSMVAHAQYRIKHATIVVTGKGSGSESRFSRGCLNYEMRMLEKDKYRLCVVDYVTIWQAFT